jgi:hypothetical protein
MNKKILSCFFEKRSIVLQTAVESQIEVLHLHGDTKFVGEGGWTHIDPFCKAGAARLRRSPLVPIYVSAGDCHACLPVAGCPSGHVPQNHHDRGPEYFRSTPKFNRYSHALDASAHTSRIRKFSFFQNEDWNDVKCIVRIFSKPAPNLTHLELAAYAPQEYPIPFPSLFGLEFPRLRVLKVAGAEDWPEIVRANLTRITVNYSFTPRVLKRCIPYSPNLKVLKIQGVWGFDEPDLTGWQKFALPPGIRLVAQYVQICPRILALPRDSHLEIRLRP